MHRRAIGSAVLACTVVIALVLPNLDGRRTAGAARREPVPDPPSVGDCLIQAPDYGQSALTFSGPPVPYVPTGPCTTANYGEVVDVVDSDDFPMTRAGGLVYPNTFGCAPPAAGYVTATRGADPSVTDVTAPWESVAAASAPWTPAVSGRVGVIGPALWQYLSGQDWLACVMYPHDPPYQGSIRSRPWASTDATAAAAFSVCQAFTEDAHADRVPCDDPHDTEVIGYARTDAEPDHLLAACTALVQAVTGMADVTAGGALAVRVAPRDTADAPATGDPRRMCRVESVAVLALTGSLVGLGDGAVPLG